MLQLLSTTFRNSGTRTKFSLNPPALARMSTFNPYSRLQNKTVFITGATAGIGEACAWNFAKAGASLVISGRRESRLNELSKAIKNECPSAKIYSGKLDIQQKSNVEKFVAELPAEYKNIDVLINNAGLVLGLDPLQNVLESDMDTMLNTNVKGLVFCTQTLLPLLKKSPSGHIINIGSIAAIEAYKNGSIYCASKHAVRAITQSLRCELADSKVKISEIDPGMVETEFSIVRFKGDKDRANQVYRGIQPLVAQDIAEIALFIASRPTHVEVCNLTVFPHGQYTATLSHRSE
ncbi:hypothetical protein BB560_003567 [Smittium megazygosporum]|uniref:Uncharacterized protein n=1 Tax=Smittium megazygosporum TaxID=133381 RepID=A0A2T9ZBP7_9FUNG|nr:hypothetical protein BB560_003567 [Smittium megazygosporum]